MVQFLPGLAYGSHPRQVLDLFLPERYGPRLFVFIHGGGWRGGDKEQYRAIGELLANFGYAVMLPNHRLAPDYPYPAPAEDIASAIAWVLRYAPESGIRPDGIFLAGHSSGGHLAALLSTHPRFLPNAGIDLAQVAGVICISAVYDLNPFIGAAESYLQPVFGPDPEVWTDASPLQQLGAGPTPPPFFLAYAEFDYPGAAAQASAMAAKLDECGSAAQIVAVPGRNHVTILTGVQSIFDPLALGLSLFLKSAAPRGSDSAL